MIKLIAFDAGWVLFRPKNWELLHEKGFTDDEGYWLFREGLGRTSDWIRYQLKQGKTSRQIIKILQQYYPEYSDLLVRIRPYLRRLIEEDLVSNIQLGYRLQEAGYQVEIWSDNGLGGPQRGVDYQDSEIGLIPKFGPDHPLYKKYPTVHTELKVRSFYSNDLCVLKKDSEFFKKVLRAHPKIKPSEMIFIEDRPKNIISAQSVGIECIQFVMSGIKWNRERVAGVPVAHTTEELKQRLRLKGVSLLDSSTSKLLYNYAPKEVDVLKTGLWAPALASRDALAHYFGRAKTKTKKGVLAYLETIFPGRTRAISFLTSPMTKKCCFYDDFKKDRILYGVDFDKLQKAGLIEAIYRVERKPCKKIAADQILWDERLPWEKVGKGLFFTKIPHYMVVLKDGFVPPEFITRCR